MNTLYFPKCESNELIRNYNIIIGRKKKPLQIWKMSYTLNIDQELLDKINQVFLDLNNISDGIIAGQTETNVIEKIKSNL
jgi:ssDNA-specific exonuclease RecJ